MAVYKGEISGIGNSETRNNEITADDVATLRDYIINWESGVIENGFAENHDITSVTIDFGVMFAYGYLGCLPKPVTFYFHKVALTQYQFIYAELDKSVIPNTFKVKTKNNQSGFSIKPTTFRQDELSTVKTGVYQLPLYRVTLTENGITQVDDLRDIKQGVKFVKYSNETKKIKNGGEIEQGVQTDFTPAVTDSSNSFATSLFVHNAIRNYIDNDSAQVNITVTFGRVDISQLEFTGGNYSEWQNIVVTPNTNYEISNIVADDNIDIEYVSSSGTASTYQVKLKNYIPANYTIQITCAL